MANKYENLVEEINKKEEIADYKTEYGDAYDALLSEKFKEIFTPYEEDNPHGVFTQCADEKHCAFCDFLSFCQRHPVSKKY